MPIYEIVNMAGDEGAIAEKSSSSKPFVMTVVLFSTPVAFKENKFFKEVPTVIILSAFLRTLFSNAESNNLEIIVG